ncbi:MAG: hypothetical protein M3379_21565 [Acidobacteriota bacterium]|nr:hypothetical protein [Acidobacteriota bacterium]
MKFSGGAARRALRTVVSHSAGALRSAHYIVSAAPDCGMQIPDFGLRIEQDCFIGSSVH